MGPLEMFGWNVLGFLPTLGALVFVSRNPETIKRSRIQLGVGE